MGKKWIIEKKIIFKWGKRERERNKKGHNHLESALGLKFISRHFNMSKRIFYRENSYEICVELT